MAADYALMVRNLLSFYDFDGKTMIAIGAGGGQFVAYGRAPRRIVAVDQDAAALDQLREAVAKNDMSDKFEFVHGDFLTMDLPVRGDLVLFDFCLHEMVDAALALTRAGGLAGDVVVFDHGRTSEWAYYVVEEEKVKVQGETAIERIEKFKTQTDIKIPLTYELALVQFS